ncbi:MAG: hypothetical protein ACR2PM_20925 [Hyphomicrobiales bacterium]
MIKLAKSLTFGAAAAALIATGATAFAYDCPREGGYGGGYSNSYYDSYDYGYKKSYSHNKRKKYSKPAKKDDAAEKEDTNDDETGETAEAETGATPKTGIFQIVDKADCKTDDCASITVRDTDGSDIQVKTVTYADDLIEASSLEEVVYHLAQNGSAVRGRLVPGKDDDGAETYSLEVEQIYS